MSIIETLVAMTVIAALLAGVIPAFVFFAKSNTRNEIRSTSVDAAERVLDDLRRQDPAGFPSSGNETASFTLDGRSYLVTTTYCPATTSHCDDVSRHVSLEVSHDGDVFYEVETVLTRLR